MQTRSSERHRTFYRGQIVLNSAGSAIDCSIRNWSETGALLFLPGATQLPDKFILSVPHKGIRSEVEVRWRQPDQAGVRFTHAPEHRETVDDRVAALEAENAKLRARIADMKRRAVERGVAHVFED